jgi:serine/threonine protein kinase
VKKINEGSQSVVYECVEKNTGASYAVKVIRKKDVETFKTLKEQYRVLKNLNHENIIKAHYLFVNYKMGTSHMVCELCRYDDLKTYL